MIGSINFDLQSFEASHKEVKKVYQKLDETTSRKTLIEAGNEGLLNALLKHFAMREKEPRKSSGFPCFGQQYPKRYFWRGTRGLSVSEKTRITLSSPSRMEGQVSINSPALAHKLSANPPEIKPKGGRRYLAIPASPIAAAWDGMPRDFPGGLRFAFSLTPEGHWLPSLIAAANYKKRLKDGSEKKGFNKEGLTRGANAGANDVAFWLVHKVKTRHDPNAMPSANTQHDAATAAVKTAVRKLLSR